MSHEPAPAAPEPEKKTRRRRQPKPKGGPKTEKPTSQKQIDANGENAQKSTGPISPEGKAKSSKNSFKHGYCALVVPIPDEDPAVFDTRFARRNAELNPAGEDVGAYAVAILVRQSQNLDRMAVAKAARLARSARDAVEDRADTRAQGVQEALRLMLEKDADKAVHRLRRTTEGCEALIREWELLKAPLLAPPHWDDADARKAQALLGNLSVVRNQAPSIVNIPTDWIVQHRQVEYRLMENSLDRPHPDVKYFTVGERKRDEWMVETLREASRLGTEWLMKVIEGQPRGLRERIAQLEENDAIDVEQATLRARVDTSDDGRLLHRYELEQQRAFFKTLAALRAEKAVQLKAP
ncbi:MAG TPA: hypothetical protein VGH33_04815 [Isosphaeraceae bacterium]